MKRLTFVLAVGFISLNGFVAAQSYESSTGTSYQYDLSQPTEQLNYSIDLDAQRRDQLNTNPNRSLDQDLGEYGGGIYD